MGPRVDRVIALGGLLFLCSGSPVFAGGPDPDLRLVNAVAKQDKSAVRALLKQRIDVNAALADGVTALLWAAHWDDLETADLLLRAGADVNASDDHGVTPLAQASENASTQMVEKLLKAGANPNAEQTGGTTPLMIGAQTGNVQLVKMLLAHGARVNAATSKTQVTPLMWAVTEGHTDVVRMLIEMQADVHRSTTKGFTALTYAAFNGDIGMARILIAAGADVNDAGSNGTHVLPFSILSNQDAFALFLLDQGADPNGAIDGVRALHAAAGTVGTWLTDFYRRLGSDNIGAIGTPLTPARRLVLVKALLARGADANARGTTTAMFSGALGYPTRGAFESTANGTGDLGGVTPLWLAAYAANGRPDTNGGRPVEERAADPAEIEIIRTLLAAGADPRIATNDGTTPLMMAAGLGRTTFAPTLLRAPRSRNAEAAVTVLLETGVDINTVNEAGFTALHGAAFRGLNEVIQILVDHGADINARDFRGRTPYRLAEGSKQSTQFQAFPETAELLKKLGADIRLGIPGTIQERARDLAVEARQQQ